MAKVSKITLKVAVKIVDIVVNDTYNGLGVALDPAGEVRLLVDAGVHPVGLQLYLGRV